MTIRVSFAASVAVAAGAILGPSPAPARETTAAPLVASELLGRWTAEAGGERVATVDLTDGPGGLAYVRNALTGQTERGRGQVRGAYLYTLESDTVVGLADRFGGPVTSSGRRRAAYRASIAGPHQLVGRIVTSNGSAPASSQETWRRSHDDNQVDILIDGPQAFPAIDAAIASAQQSICLQTFSWFDDDHGRHMVDVLDAAHRRGVQVRCLVEAFPQKGGVGWKMGKLLRERGIDLIIHHTVTEGVKTSIGNFFRKIGNFFKGQKDGPRENRGLFSHDHRKLIVVDGRVAFTGGMNIGDKYNLGTTWHDIHSRVEGSAVPRMEALFYDRWHAAGGEGEPTPVVANRTGPGSLPVEVLENLPGVRLEIRDRYLQEMAACKSEVLIENAYLLYDPVLDVLKRQAQAGVHVLAILPSNDLNDEAFARDAFLWVQNDVVRAGVELYKYRKRMCHGKVAVFDGRKATLGTANLDAMAMERNAELNLFIADRGFARTLTQRVWAVDVPNADRVTVSELPWWKKVVAGTMHAVRSML